MKNKNILLLLISMFLLVAIAIRFTYDKSYNKLNFEVYKKGTKIRKNANVIVSGKIRFSYDTIEDKDYKVSFPFSFIKRVKNVAKPEDWYDEKPVYFMNNGNINGLHFSQKSIESLCDTIVKHDVNYRTNDKDFVPNIYSDSKYPYFTKTNEEGLWRVRYYTKEIDSEKEYTYIGKWNGKSLDPIKGVKPSLFEGVLKKEDIINSKNTIKIVLFNTSLGIAIVLTFALIIIIFTDKKKTKAL